MAATLTTDARCAHLGGQLRSGAIVGHVRQGVAGFAAFLCGLGPLRLQIPQNRQFSNRAQEVSSRCGLVFPATESRFPTAASCNLAWGSVSFKRLQGWAAALLF